MSSKRHFIPALRFHFLTPLYDTVLKYVMRERSYKEELCRIVPLDAKKILDVGCGTGTLTIMMKQTHRASNIHGVDIDEEVLQIARQKFHRQSLDISLYSDTVLRLPFENNSFDAAFSCLVIHHLKTEDKQKAIREIYRILRPGGRLALADFSPPHNFPMMIVTKMVQYLEETYDNFNGRLLEFIPQAGFSQLSVEENFWTPLGTVSIITATKPID